jgi:hypothetical protein
MDMDEVEVVRAEHSVQTDDPAGVPGRPGAEAPDRSAAGGVEAGREVRFPRQEVCDGRFDDVRIAESGLLHEQPLGAARAQPFDQPKNRQGRVNTSARPLGGDHAR